jgi:LPS sulfotransferase NodH
MYNYFLHLHTSFIIKKKEILNQLLTKKHQYVSFVILCEPRTGSTLLHTYLNFHPNIKSYGEAIREHIEKNHSADAGFLKNNIFKPHGRHLKAVGLKLFYFYYDHPAYADAFKEIIEQKDIKIIHLIREDILKLYVSLKLAQKTNTWSSSNANQKNKPKIFVKADEFKLFAETYVQRQQYFKTQFKTHDVLVVRYEDLIMDSRAVLEKTQKFLGVKPKHLSSLLKKQNADALESVVVNYHEVHNTIEQIVKEVTSHKNKDFQQQG